MERPRPRVTLRTEGSTQWAPGHSGNPLGRPGGLAAFQKLCRENSTVAMERLLIWVDSDDAATSLTAIKELWNRAWGKAPSIHVVEGDLGVNHQGAVDLNHQGLPAAVIENVNTLSADELARRYIEASRAPPTLLH